MHDCGEAELEHNKNDEFNQLKKSRALHLLSFRFPCFCTKFTFFVHLGRVGYFCSKLTCYEPRNRRLRVNNGLMTKVVPATCADTQGSASHVPTTAGLSTSTWVSPLAALGPCVRKGPKCGPVGRCSSGGLWTAVARPGPPSWRGCAKPPMATAPPACAQDASCGVSAGAGWC